MESVIKKIINKVPASDTNARQQYKGERHALILLHNNKLGLANYLGPGTNIIKRLIDNDPPRTYTDKIAKLHDINYCLSTYDKSKVQQLNDIRHADTVMLNQLEISKLKKLDNKFNIAIGEKFIKSKVALEDVGVLDRGKFSGSLNMYPEKYKSLLLSEKSKLFK